MRKGEEGVHEVVGFVVSWFVCSNHNSQLTILMAVHRLIKKNLSRWYRIFTDWVQFQIWPHNVDTQYSFCDPSSSFKWSSLFPSKYQLVLEMPTLLNHSSHALLILFHITLYLFLQSFLFLVLISWIHDRSNFWQ